ncbi:uncharacterized protein SPPG_07564 [Spizellomyces punctatus DAOM BR117]|uniref:Uncharacterized protein n=1 Tax=Spizellomyces punctatus (strain DAOM BR117) TaxID=645134 RepID=A0A0L0H7I2_SPIPD|nr:uncharacterized protein SPPG_07564 [Spizellomyces punctatus DAOM BR117]KNC97177.1 hypothetical protein SPPG_07564 [Spizellomyces punctatus DAOM BR117]|eukprot:XP_016605217.1 hypothetical protein SPPG_07564 [Spizellomyces punctatus DAOM BR117]
MPSSKSGAVKLFYVIVTITCLASFLLISSSSRTSLQTFRFFQQSLPPVSNDRKTVVDRLYRMGHYNWIDYLDTMDEEGLSPLTKEVQKWIYDNQHPPKEECRKKKFLIAGGTENVGLGAYLHKQGFLLAAALEAGWIYVLEPIGTENGKYEFSDNCGPPNGPVQSNLECFTQPYSSCTYEDALQAETKVRTNTWGTVDLDGASYDKDLVPSLWKKNLQEKFPNAELTLEFFRLWWRGQSSAYLSRLNAQTTDALLSLRLKESLHNAYSANSNNVSKPAPYPLPEGTFNLHVRHGDKGSEMTLIPFSTYIETVQKYAAENPMGVYKRLFVSSEDPEVIHSANLLPISDRDDGTTSSRTWEIFTSDIPRYNKGPMDQLSLFGRSTMTLSWYLQLWMGLECDGWVGTRASNWNRIIDEFRCIFVAKCRLPYFEVGLKNDWKGYFW